MPHVISDSQVTQKTKSMHNAYNMPHMLCATCKQTTRGSFHEKCRRVNGRLVVEVPPPGKKFRGQ